MTIAVFLLTAAFAFACGWFLAAYAVTNGIRSDLRQLDRERQELDDEREALHIAWSQAPEPRVELELGRHKRLRNVVS